MTMGVAEHGGSPTGQRCESEAFCNLAGPVKDMRGLAEAVNLQAGAGSSGLAWDFQHVALEDEEVTVENLRRSLERLDPRPEDVIWIAMSGHGEYLSGDGDDSGEFYLITPGAKRSFASYMKSGEGRAFVSAGEISEVLGDFDARRIILTADTCYSGNSGPVFERNATARLQEIGAPLGMEMVFAAKPGRLTYDSEEEPSRLIANLIQSLDQAHDQGESLTVRTWFRQATSTIAEKENRLEQKMIDAKWGPLRSEQSPWQSAPADTEFERRLSLGSEIQLLVPNSQARR